MAGSWGGVATDYYAVLGVRRDATSEEIKRAKAGVDPLGPASQAEPDISMLIRRVRDRHPIFQ